MSFAHRPVLDAARVALHAGERGVLACVLETEGSTYVRAGAAAWFGQRSRAGWLSGGCLEAEIAQRAGECAAAGRLGWLEIDTRDDEDLLSASSAGCRGRLRLALIPLAILPGAAGVLDGWFTRVEAMVMTLSPAGTMHVQFGEQGHDHAFDAEPCPWPIEDPAKSWDIAIPPLPRVAIFGAGPESALLLPLLRSLGMRTLLVERRRRWDAVAGEADRRLEMPPAEALQDEEFARAPAALVMHHHFEFDREALEALAGSAHGFVGLLGPRRRRDDLFKLLPTAAREALEPRLRSPVGLDLGGQGAEAIALSIAAQLQGWRHGH